VQDLHHHEHRHLGWDATIPAAAEIAPGDDVEVGSIGWTALIPGFGLLADDFPDPRRPSGGCRWASGRTCWPVPATRPDG
jgi:acetamidase/formamidase